MATYAIGDIQGCLTPMRCLLNEVSFNRKTDRLWLVGDIVNRGPESLQTLRYIKSLGECVTLVLGNHELHLLAVANGHKQSSRSDTLEDILAAPDLDDLLRWLRRQKILHHDPQLQFTMVHAGIPPQWKLKEACQRAAELETVLQGKDFNRFLSEMYGNQPDCWDPDLRGHDRLRVITNYFTRMRFCDPQGLLELSSKSGPEQAPPGFAPWFSHPNRKTRKHKIIFGHWASLEGKTKGANNLYPLDTGCVWGKHLTMMKLEDETLYTCQCTTTA